MKSRLLSAVALTAIVLPGAALAGDEWYGRAAVGFGTTGDIDYTDENGRDLEIQSQGHVAPLLALGYALPDSGWRVELSLEHQWNDTGAVGNLPNTDSNIHSYPVMANVFYDFNEAGRFQPFIGGGAGIMLNNVRGVSPDFENIDDADSSMALQGMAGIGWALSERLIGEVYYRYLWSDDIEVNTFGGTTDVALEDFQSHDVMFGLRYDLQPDAAPPPPPPPPPPPAPPPPPPPPPAAPSCEDVAFVVYFEWDKSFLTDQAKSIISEAADRAEECGVANVRIEGHADRSGAASYNVGLSQRRADAVKQQLITQGVAASSITTEAFGESQPAVETPDGVREPLNRRSEVVIRVSGATS